MFDCGDKKSGGAAGGIKDSIVFAGVHHLDDEIDDVSRRSELACLALGAGFAQQVLIGVAQVFGILIAESVYLLQEKVQGAGSL